MIRRRVLRFCSLEEIREEAWIDQVQDKLKLNARLNKFARFLQQVLKYVYNYSNQLLFYICKIIDHGEFGKEKLHSIVQHMHKVLNF